MTSAALHKIEPRSRIKRLALTPATEFILWGAAFLLLRLIIVELVDTGPFYRDEVAFTEGGLRMAANRLDSGDYIHGPVIYYLMLGAYSITAALKLVAGHISNIDGFLRWYVEDPESLRLIGRVVTSVGGAATIAATMSAAHAVSLSRTQARVAGLILLGMPLFHHASWYVKEDLWAGLFGILAAVSIYRSKSPVKAGIFWGIAIASKYTAVTFAPALLFIVARMCPSPEADWKLRMKSCLRCGLAAAVTFFVLNPYVLIHLKSFLAQLQQINAQYIEGGYFSIGKPPLLAGLVFSEFLPFGIGIAALLCAIGALAFSRGKIAREQLPFLLAPLTVIALLAFSRSGFARTLALILPWLAVFASAVCHPLNEKSRYKIAALGLMLALMAIWQAAGFYRYVTAADTREMARAFVERNIAPDSVILMEGIHEQVAETGLTLRPNLNSLNAESKEIMGKGGHGRLNQIRQEVAAAGQGARFEILPSKDFVMSGEDNLDHAQVVITCKWPSVFPDSPAFNVPEDPTTELASEYLKKRQAFYDVMGAKGFHLVAEFRPTLGARWSFIDRADPKVFRVTSWLDGESAIVGPVIAIYTK